MNCLAGCFQMAGTVMTHLTSAFSNSEPAWSLSSYRPGEGRKGQQVRRTGGPAAALRTQASCLRPRRPQPPALASTREPGPGVSLRRRWELRLLHPLKVSAGERQVVTGLWPLPGHMTRASDNSQASVPLPEQGRQGFLAQRMVGGTDHFLSDIY